VRGRRLVAAVVSGLVLGAWCGWASGFHRGTGSAWATWVVSVAGVVAVDVALWSGRRGRMPRWRLEPVAEPWPRPGRSRRSAWVGSFPWLALAAVVVAWEVLGIDTGAHRPHLTISALTQAFRPLNAAMLLVWILVGVGYGVARARTPAGPGGPGRSPVDTGGQGKRTAAMVAPGPAVPPSLLLPADRGVGVGFWLAVLAAGVIADLTARRSDGRTATAEELVRFVSTPPWAKIMWAAAWAFAGYHLFAH
jgi:hypothetical protein